MSRPHRLLRACLLALLWLMPLGAWAQPGANEHRVALIIGNAGYKTSPLKNPVNDARAMRDKLKAMGFEVVYFENLQVKQVGSALREFRNAIRAGSVALFFYAVHGLQLRGENYFPTIDAELHSEEDVPYQALSLSAVLNTMEDSKAAVNLVLLDACRNNPYARNFRTQPQGLARVQAPSGTLIHYATRPGSVAEDGKGKHGTYTEALLAQIDDKNVPIETALKRVTIRVREATKGKQEPWMEGSLTGDFYFIVSPGAQVTVSPSPAPTTSDEAAWQAADSIGSAAAYQAYLGEYPKGLYAAAARIKLAALAAASGGRPAAAAAPATAAPAPGRPVAATRPAAEAQAWEAALRNPSIAAYQGYLQAYPGGRYSAQAGAAIEALRQPAPEPPVVVAVAPPAEALRPPSPQQLADAEREALRTAALRELSLGRIGGADFVMGADADEQGDDGTPDASAQPSRVVTVGHFELAYYELNIGQFRKFVDATGYKTEAESAAQPGCMVPAKGGAWVQQPAANWRAPGYPVTDGHPVVCVSFNDVQAYLQWLNGGGERLRLASEAEWEFGARAGTTSPRPWSETPGFFGRIWSAATASAERPVSRSCRYANIADQRLAPVLEWPAVSNCDDGYAYAVPGGYFGRNNFSLYDMIGNAAEWVQDCWNPNHAGAPTDSRARVGGDCTRHVVRGGSWASPPGSIRSAARSSQPHSYRASDLGFRLARSPAP